MNEGMLRRLIRRGLDRGQTAPEATEQANEPIDASAAVVEVEDDDAPDEYEPEYSWGPVASAPAHSPVDRRRPQARREHP